MDASFRSITFCIFKYQRLPYLIKFIFVSQASVTGESYPKYELLKPMLPHFIIIKMAETSLGSPVCLYSSLKYFEENIGDVSD